MLRHSSLLLGRLQYRNQFVCEIGRTTDLVETDRHIFIRRHITKIGEVSAHDWNAKLASLVGWSTRPRGGVIGHHYNRGCPEKIRNILFWNISAKLDAGTGAERLTYRFPISRLRVMVGSPDNQLGIRHLFEDSRKSFEQRFQSFVGSPVSDRQNAMFRMTTLRKVWRGRGGRERPVGA